MSLGRFLETAVASDDPAYLEHAHFFATKDAIACFTFDAVAPLRVSPPTRIIAAATPLETFAQDDPAEKAADVEAKFGSNDAMDADPAGCVARYMRASEYAVHLAAARWAAANHPAGANGATASTSRLSSSFAGGGGGSGGSLSPVATSRPHSRKGSALGGGVGDPAVAPVVDGPDAMLLPDRSHLKSHVLDSNRGSGIKARRTAVTAYYPLQFDALRKATLADGDEGYAASLASVAKWDGGAKGGKSGSSFGKTRDDRFIVKQLSRVELNAFLADFGPAYFKHARESLDRPNGGGSTCLARILGAYQVATCREGADGEDQAIVDFIVMENLFRGRDVFDPRWLTYDLKGSLRARYNVDDADDDVGDAAADTAARDPGRVAAVLLDENLQRRLATHPILCDVESKSELDRTLARDTAFLANEGVMDYSLLAGVDRASGELVVGVVDYLRLYTWDKQLESYVKFTGVLGGGVAAEPTVISPVQYRRRFRKAMARYFVVVPA